MVQAELLQRNLYPPSASKEPYTSTFDGARLQQVIAVIKHPDVEKAMRRGRPHIPAATIVGGEVGRLGMLAEPFHPDFYHESLRKLMVCGAIKQGYSLVELGMSLLGHLPGIPSEHQPGLVLGLDNQRHIVAAAKVALGFFQEQGLLNVGKHRAILGDHESRGLKSDVSIMSLASQYDAGPVGTVLWLMKHDRIAGVNGDVAHSPFVVSQQNLIDGILPITDPRLPVLDGYTGVNLKLLGDPKSTPFGEVYDYTFLLDKEIYNPRNGIVQISRPGGELQGKVTVFKRNGKTYAEPWAWVPTAQATKEDIANFQAIKITFNELYSELEPATRDTDLPREWEATAAFGVPVYAAELGYKSVVMLNTATQVAKKSGMLPMTILLRNGDEAKQIFEKGLFSQVGEGKYFKDIGHLNSVLRSYMSNPQRFSEIVDYTNPPLVTSITTRHQDVFDRLRQVAA